MGAPVKPIVDQLYSEYLEIAYTINSDYYVHFLLRIRWRDQIVQLAKIRSQCSEEDFPEALARYLDGTTDKDPYADYGGWKFVNCAGCGCEVNALEIAGRIKTRPYCHDCLEPQKLTGSEGFAPRTKNDTDHWHEHQVRDLEDWGS